MDLCLFSWAAQCFVLGSMKVCHWHVNNSQHVVNATHSDAKEAEYDALIKTVNQKSTLLKDVSSEEFILKIADLDVAAIII